MQNENIVVREITKFDSPQQVQQFMLEGNELYLNAQYNQANISKALRHKTNYEGQSPYAVVVACSDSRVTPEHIFSAGIGELFVIRNAGNIITEVELASIEYAILQLGCKLVVILGHTNCGAIQATLDGFKDGHMIRITKKIASALQGGEHPERASILNVEHGVETCLKNELLKDSIQTNKIAVKGAIYKTKTGKVSFL